MNKYKVYASHDNFCFQALARAFQDMGQDENNDYKELSIFLATGMLKIYILWLSRQLRLYICLLPLNEILLKKTSNNIAILNPNIYI